MILLNLVLEFVYCSVLGIFFFGGDFLCRQSRGCKRCVCTHSRPTLCDPVDCSPPGSSVHGILQAGILEWVPFSPPGIFLTQGSNLSLLPWQVVPYHWATGEALSANRDTFISYFLDGMLLFYSCHRAVIRLPSTTLNNNIIVSAQPCLVPSLKGKAFGLSPLVSP